MSAADYIGLIVALVGAVATILGVIIPVQFRLNRNIRQTRYEITNDHDEPLRNQMDRQHAENQSSLGLVLSQQKLQARDIGGMRQEMRHYGERLYNLEEWRLEQTGGQR